MRPARRVFRVVLLIVVGIGLAIGAALVVEGVVSLWSGRSLFRRSLAAPPSVRAALRDDELRRAATTTAGPFRLSNDPLVGFLMKADREHALVGVPAQTDEHGMRRRVAGPPSSEQPRIVVLGDSVAFGMGVADDETYATRIERMIADALPEAAPRPAVLTVACPGWNLSNSTRYLRTHLDELAPQIVVLLPINNDFEDASVVTESGQRAFVVDPVGGARHAHVSHECYLDLYLGLGSRTPLPRLTEIVAAGGPDVVQHVLRTGVAPESRRRLAGMVDDVRRLGAVLDRRGARLLVVFNWAEDFGRLLDSALRVGVPDQPVTFLHQGRTPADGLVDDPHPNPRCIVAGARLIVGELIERGWLKGADASRLPDADERYASRRAQRLERGASQEWATQFRRRIERFLSSEIRLDDALGFQQVYSGMDADGTVGQALWIALRSDGAERLRIVATPIAGAASLSGLALRVEVATEDGQIGVPIEAAFGSLRADGTMEWVGELGAPIPAGAVVDVLVRPSACVEETVDGRSRLAAFRVRQIALC